MQFNGYFDDYHDHDGQLVSRTSTAEWSAQGQDTSSYKVAVSRDFDSLTAPFAVAGTAIPVGDYEWTSAELTYASNQSRRVYGSASVEAGNYYSGARQTAPEPVNFPVGRTLLFEPKHTRNRVTLPGRAPFASNVHNRRVSRSLPPRPCSRSGPTPPVSPRAGSLSGPRRAASR